jgi:two-component system phosphate regulon sensor histidine kinase PhoR
LNLATARNDPVHVYSRRRPSRLRTFLTLNGAAIACLIAVLVLWQHAVRRGVGPAGPLVWGLGLLLATGLALSTWRFRHLYAFIDRLKAAALGMAGGHARTPYVSADGELQGLADAFNHMCGEVASRQLQLRETADRLATVLGAMAEGVLAVDNRQRILFANPAAGHLLGLHPEAARGKRLLEVVRSHMLHEAVSEALAHRDVPDQETQRYEFDSSRSRGRILSVRANRLPGEPCPGVVLVLQDVTELRRLEHLRQEFVANVSHELKTPLTAIKAYTETLQAGAIDDAAINRHFLDQIEREADRLLELIVDMLRLAQIESGHEGFRIGSVSVYEAMLECRRRHETAARRKGIKLLTTSDDKTLTVRADKEGFRQILDNLVDNAIKYTDPGGQVVLGWHDDETEAVIEVCDTGIGIPAEAQERVFERFYRVDKARSRDVGSTGLGLSIVKHLAHTFGGSVSVESQLDEGSRFTVRLPTTHRQEEGSRERPPAAELTMSAAADSYTRR